MFYLILFHFIPLAICGYICEQRNRNALKGVVVGLLFSWLSVLILWLTLRRRDAEGYLM